jgi:hypothetical protein
MLFACVLECSSIGAMVFLTIVVVITRIGVNKEHTKPTIPPEPAPVPEALPTSPTTDSPAPIPTSRDTRTTDTLTGVPSSTDRAAA